MKRFQALSIICIFIIGFVLSCGCTGATSYVGRYEDERGNYVQLNSDGSFKTNNVYGDYQIEGNKLSFCAKEEYMCMKVGNFENGKLNMLTTGGGWHVYTKVK